MIRYLELPIGSVDQLLKLGIVHVSFDIEAACLGVKPTIRTDLDYTNRQ